MEAAVRARRVSEPSIPRDPSLPQEGDVVVTRESRSAVRYTVRRFPGVVQFSASTREAAVQLARGFARKHALDIWYVEGDTCRLLEAYRGRGSREP